MTHLQQELASHIAALHAWHLAIRSAAQRLDLRKPAITDAAMCKAEGVDAAIKAVDFTMRLYGAAGVDIDAGLAKRHADLMALRIADGTSDVLRGQVFKGVVGSELYNAGIGRGEADIGSYGESRRYW